MARIWPMVLLIALLAGCQTRGKEDASPDVTGRDLGPAQWQHLNAAHARTRFPKKPRREILHSAKRYLPAGRYQETFLVHGGGAQVVVLMDETGDGGFSAKTSPGEFRRLFAGRGLAGGRVPVESLRPTMEKGVQWAAYQHENRPCIVFYRIAGHVVQAAFGSDGSVYLAGSACGPAGTDPAGFKADMIKFAAGIRVGRK